MTSTVSDVTRSLLGSDAYEALATTLDVIAVLLLIVLLVEQELVRAYFGGAGRSRVKPLGIAITPLVLAFVVIAVARAKGLR